VYSRRGLDGDIKLDALKKLKISEYESKRA